MKKFIISILLVTLVLPMFAIAESRDHKTMRLGRALGQFWCYNGHLLIGDKMDYTECVNGGYGRYPMGTNPTPSIPLPAPVSGGK